MPRPKGWRTDHTLSPVIVMPPSGPAERLPELFLEVVDLEPDERAAYLDRACSGDPELRREIDSLLKASDRRYAAVRQDLDRLFPGPDAGSTRPDPRLDPDAAIVAGPRPVSGDDAPERLANALASRYRIEREIGAGGMATVYLAEDVRHERKVAIKVLRPELAAVLGAERFLTEIRVTANLQHPHILPLHDSGEIEGFLYYVMPFIEGESLRDRLDRERQLSVEDALRITSDVADGLSHAHGLGVVHRDIKPGNILLTADHALVADFGIAKAVREAGGTRLTATGISPGTPQYMSPEQASGEIEVDSRSDEYSLGCVLYEMLAGEAPHTGPTAQAILARVLTHPAPSARESRETVPLHVDAAIRKALSRLPADRFGSVRQFAEALRDSDLAVWNTLPGTTAVPGRTPRRSFSTVLAWSLVAILGITVLGLLFFRGSRRSGPAAVARFALDPAPAERVSIGDRATEIGAEVDALAISDDGQRIAFVAFAAGDSTSRLFVRTLGESIDAREIPGTEGAASPFFSPDGEWLGFYSWKDGRLKTAPMRGGEPQVICECDPILSADWGPDGTIVMDHEGLLGLRIVPASGGDPELLPFDASVFESDEHSMSHPRFLPDGRHVLATAWGSGAATRRIVLLPVDGGERVTLLEEGWAPQYARSGHLVYLRTNQLWAVPFDPRALEVMGTAEPVLDSVFSTTFMNSFAVSGSGTLVYAQGIVPTDPVSLYLADRNGEVQRLPGGPAMPIIGPRFSPAGDRIAFWGSDPSGLSGGQGSARIWMYDRTNGSTDAVTDAGPGDFWPLWAPDGRSLVFTSLRNGPTGALYRAPVDGSATPAALPGAGSVMGQAGSWLPGGAGLIFQRMATMDSDFDIWLLPLGEGGPASPLVEEPGNQVHASLSPDGRWLAYASDQSGRYEIYVRPYPGLDGGGRVSNGGGMGPLWRSDSRELYFYTRESERPSTFMRVPISETPGTPEPMWSRADVTTLGGPYGVGYDVTPDGQEFLVALNEQPSGGSVPHLRLVFNWLRELEERFEQ